MVMFHTSFSCTNPGAAKRPHPLVPSSPSSAPDDLSPSTPAPTIRKKRKRVDARQFKVLSAVLSRTQYPTTEEREQLATDLGMRPRRVQIWLAHAFVCAACIITD